MLHHANRASLATTRDPNFEYVTLLMHGDGTNGGQNNTFIDGSTNNFTITRNGNTTQGTFSPFGTLWGNYFDGTGDYLAIADNANLELSNSDFTIECWINVPATSNFEAIVAKNGNTTGSWSLFFNPNASGNLQFWSFDYNSFGSQMIDVTGVTIRDNLWHHIALVRNGSSWVIYVDGISRGTQTSSITIANGTQPVWIGNDPQNTTWFIKGYISNFRLVKGTAVYTAAFTPPTQPLTAITNTQLLTCQSNCFVDNSSNAFAITVNGDTRAIRFSPFNPPGEYSTSIIGGGGYFDGTGDDLSIADNTTLQLSNSVCTVEAWVYVTSYTATVTSIVSKFTYGATPPSTRNGWYFFIFGTASVNDTLCFRAETNGTIVTNIQASVTLALNTWYHVAFTNDGTTRRLFVNGKSQTLVASTYAAWTDTTAATTIGSIQATLYLPGYISNCRIVKGTAVYTADFTVPAAPLTAIANTALLCNFSNASIIDNAMMQVPETVGNAQISTSVRRFGTGSLAFDGTGDWLLMPHTVDQFLGTGNFTIELWLYLAATGAARGLVAKGTSTTGWLISTNASNQVVFTYGTSTITSTGAISGTTWTHIAVVREGTGTNQTKIYINGTNDGTGTVSTDFNQTSVMYVGANRTAGNALNGNIDDLRITKGIARYTANFTPRNTPFPNM